MLVLSYLNSGSPFASCVTSVELYRLYNPSVLNSIEMGLL